MSTVVGVQTTPPPTSVPSRRQLAPAGGIVQNGQLRQNSSTSQLIFNCFQLVSFVSTNMTLLPGDVILTGTPEGVGPVEVDDEMEIFIEGIGNLTNKVKKRD